MRKIFGLGTGEHLTPPLSPGNAEKPIGDGLTTWGEKKGGFNIFVGRRNE